MAEMKEIVRMAIDAYHGKPIKYSVDESMETLRNALVAANNGSTTLNYKNIRDNKCTGLFTIVEEILSRTIVEGFQGDEYFNTLVDFRNVALGDENRFLVEDSNLFTVSKVADGTLGVRRQRLGGATVATVNTELRMVRIYEELNRVLSGQIDFNKFIQVVSDSFRQQFLNDIYTLWNTATVSDFGGSAFFPAAGTYDEDVLLDVIAHVEAAAGGKNATIVGTKKALRNLKMSVLGTGAENDLYTMGYYGNFFGSPVVAVPQRHKVGSTSFALDDDTITVIAGEDRPIKFVYEGQSTIILGDPTRNGDLTQEYTYAEKYGLGIILAGGNSGVGRYKITKGATA